MSGDEQGDVLAFGVACRLCVLGVSAVNYYPRIAIQEDEKGAFFFPLRAGFR
jgi:hypothetical protein